MKIKITAIISAIIISTAIFSGCALFSDSSDSADTQTSVETEASEEVLINVVGKVLRVDTLENPDGGYILSIPDSWMGKVSYEFDGVKTIFYHITKDGTQPEQNPVIVTINIAKQGESFEGESFLEFSGKIFYRSVRFGAPYTKDSDDALQYNEIFNSVPEVLNTLALKTEEKPIVAFNASDINFGDYKLGDTKEALTAALGEPISTQEIVWEATGETRDINEYSFGQLVYVDGVLVVAQVTDDTFSGPRSIKVGMTIDQVAAKFSCDAELDVPSTTIYYRANPGCDIYVIIPPSAVLHKGELQTLAFSVFTDESGAVDMTPEELEQNYMFLEQYDLLCEFDADGVMYSFAVRRGTPSE